MMRSRRLFDSILWRVFLLLVCAVVVPACGRSSKNNIVFVLPFGIVTTSLPNATVNVAYSTTLTAQAGTAPYLWTILSGNLPAGISLSPSTGVIAGTAAANASSSFLVRLTDSANNSAVRSFTLTVTGGAGGGLSISTGTLPPGTQGETYSGALSASGGTPSYTWAITSGVLPAGLTLNVATGQIVGTPTTASGGAVSVTFTVTDSLGANATTAVLITINNVPAINTTVLPNGEVGVAYSQTLATSGGTAPFTFAVSAGSLPGGLTLDGSSGTISGSPLANGTFSFTATLTDAAGATASQALSILVASDPVITTTSLPAAPAGSAYNQALAATGGTGALTWTKVAGTLPPPMVLSGAGVISGTPPLGGSNGLYSFTVKVTDADGKSATQTLSISVTGATVTALTISTPSPLPTGDQGVNYSASLSASGGTPPYTWIVNGAPALPAGLSLSAAGQITGVPTAATGGAVIVNFKVTDSAGVPQTANAGLSITINTPVSFTTASLPAADQTYAYTQTLTAAGGSGSYTFAVTSGALPAGLSLNGATGVLSGTPTGLGTSNFTVTASDGLGGGASMPLSILVYPPITVTTASLPAWTRNKAGYSVTLAASGGSGSYTWTSPGPLPTGLALSAAGVISGTPTVANTFPFTVVAKDSLNNSGSANLSIVINPAIVINTTTAAAWTQNAPGYTQTLSGTPGTGSLVWTVTGGAPPTGLTLSPAGVLSGTPTSAPATTSFTVTATDSVGATASGLIGITINAVPSITDASPLPNGDPSVAYSKGLTPAGGTGALTWSLSAGALPAGYSIAPGTGIISGSTAATGTFNFTIKVQDTTGSFGTKAFALTINNIVTVTTPSLPVGEQGVVYGGATLAASGGSGGYTWGLSTTPAGMAFNTGTGVLSGTPTATGTTPITFTATDSLGGTGQATLSLTVNPPVTVTGTTPAWTKGQTYAATITASAGVPPYVWTAPTGLPAGITATLGATTVTLGAAATATGTFTPAFKVTDSVGGTFTLSPTLVINGVVGLSGSVPAAWNKGTAFSATLTPTAGTTPYTWTVSGLPPGIITTPASGGTGATLVFSGTPTTKGPYTVSVTVTDTAGSTANQSYPVQINDPLTITGVLPAAWDQGAAFTPTLGATGGTAPYSWVVTTHPAGLTPSGLATATLSFTGNPTTLGASSFNITLNDSAAGSVNITPAITINAPLVMSGQGAFPLNLDQGASFTPSLTASGGTVGYTWVVTGLPVGLSATPSGGSNPTLNFSGATGAAAVSYPLNITLTDTGGGSVVFTPTLVVHTTLSISGLYPVAWDQNAAFTPTLTAAGGFGPFVWTVTNLPAGLTSNPTAGTLALSGTPTTVGGPTTIHITLTDAAGGSATFNPPITINPALGISGALPAAWDQNLAFNQSLSATGGTGTMTWTVTGLPTGITSSSSGANNVNRNFSGSTAVAPASFPLSINVTDQGGGSFTINPSLAINQALAMAFPFPSAWDQNVGFNPAVTATGGTGTLTWTVTNMPPGITFGSTGPNLNIGGAPNTAASAVLVTIKVADTVGASVTNSKMFTVHAPLVITTSTLPPGMSGAFYSVTILNGGGTAPFVWNETGALPTGMGFNTSTGTLSGTPASTGTFPLTFSVTDAGGGAFSTGTINLVINSALALSPTGGALAAGTVGSVYGGSSVTVSGGNPGYGLSVSSGSTPPGLTPTIGGTSVSFGGTPTTGGTFNFTIRANDSLGAVVTGNYSIAIAGGSSPLTLNPPPGTLPPGDVGQTYSFGLTASGGTSGPYNFAVSAGAPPGGVGLSPSSGVLSGTMSGAPGPYTFSVMLTDGVNPAVTNSYTINMSSALNNTTPGFPQGDAGFPYVGQGQASGGSPPLNWFVTGTLPTGLFLNSASGQISGTTSSIGTFPFSLSVTDAAGVTQTKNSLQIVIVAPPTINSFPVPAGTQGSPYTSSPAPSASGGTGPYTWTVSGAPSGITMNAGTGVLSGTTALQGTFPLTVTVTDLAGGTGTASPSLVINPGPLTVTTTTLSGGDVGVAYSQPVVFFGGKAPYFCTITAGALPPGAPAFAISNAGLITGTPNTVGTFSFTVTVTDSTTPSAQVVNQPLSITVAAAPTISTLLLPEGQANVFYSAKIVVAGGSAPLTFALSGSALPTGITLDTSAGVISGTTSSTGTVSGLTITVTDATGGSANKTYSLKIDPTLGNQGNFSIGQIRLPDAVAGQAYTGNVYVTTGSGNHYTYTVDDPTLLPPGGFAMTSTAGTGSNNLPNSGVLTGTPTLGSEGDYTFTVVATDPGGNIAKGNVLLVVLAPPADPAAIPTLAITTSSLPGATTQVQYPATQILATGGRAPYTWGASGNNGLPFGMALSKNGVLYGNPGQAGTFALEIYVIDSSSPQQFVPKTIPLVVTAGAGYQITSLNLGTVNVGGPAANINLTTSGGTAPSIWVADTKGLQHMGLTFSAAGMITGSATAMGLIHFPMGALDSSSPALTAGGEGTLTVGTTFPISVTSLAIPAMFFGQAYSFQLTATGGTGAYTWTVRTDLGDKFPDNSNTNLSAAGLITYPTGPLNNNGGNNNSRMVFQVTDGTNTTLVAIDVNLIQNNNNTGFSNNGPNLTNLQTGTQGQAYLGSMGNPGFNNGSDDDWSTVNSFPNGFLVTSGLPAVQGVAAGLTVDPARGTMSGTPSTPGHYTLHLVTTEISPGGNHGNSNVSVESTEDHALLDIMPPNGSPFQIVTRNLPPGREGAAYSSNPTIQVANGVGGYAFVILSGNLPPGLVLDAANGILSGTPTQSGIYSFVVKVTQTGGATALMHYDLPIDTALPFGIFTPRLADANQGLAYTGQLYGAGASGAINWGDAGSPTTFASLGLSLNAGTGAVTGTPTPGLAPGVYQILVTATNSAHTSVRPVNLLIEPLPIMISPFLLSRVGTPISANLAASGGSGSYTYAVAPGSLLTPGVVLSGPGALTGTPTATTGFRNSLVIITDTNTSRVGYGGMQGIAFPPNLPTLSFQINTNGGGGGNQIQIGAAYSQSYGAQGGTPGYTYSDTPHPPSSVNDLRPPGLLLSTTGVGAAAQGLLSGNPTQTGFYTYQMRVTDQAPATADQFLELTVSPDSNGGGSSVFGIQTNRIPNGLSSAAYPPTQLQYNSNGGPAATWAPISGIPAGWSLNSQGQVSGPAISAGTYYLIVQINNGVTTSQGRIKLVIQ